MKVFLWNQVLSQYCSITFTALFQFCLFGFLQCVDTFLFFAAFLPIRVVIAVVHLFSYPCAVIFSV